MTEHRIHPDHSHAHAAQCGHTAIHHDDHADYLHDGHLHRPHGDHVDEHIVAVAGPNPAKCTPQHTCPTHDATHSHSPVCGHEAVPHGDHSDFLAVGHLHFSHGNHCDDHGPVRSA